MNVRMPVPRPTWARGLGRSARRRPAAVEPGAVEGGTHGASSLGDSQVFASLIPPRATPIKSGGAFCVGKVETGWLVSSIAPSRFGASEARSARTRLQSVSDSPSRNRYTRVAVADHEATAHSEQSVRSSTHFLDWSNQPRPFKIFLARRALPARERPLRARSGAPRRIPSVDARPACRAARAPRGSRPARERRPPHRRVGPYRVDRAAPLVVHGCARGRGASRRCRSRCPIC